MISKVEIRRGTSVEGSASHYQFADFIISMWEKLRQIIAFNLMSNQFKFRNSSL